MTNEDKALMDKQSTILKEANPLFDGEHTVQMEGEEKKTIVAWFTLEWKWVT